MVNKDKYTKLFGEEWSKHLINFLNSTHYKNIKNHLLERKNKRKVTIYPDFKDIYKAFKITPLNKVKVVILGQDPYYNPDKACGLAFGIDCSKISLIPPSLENIHKELETDLDTLILDFNWSLEHWGKQGVLLLNTALTVEENSPGSHAQLWKPFTKEIIRILNHYDNNIIWVLWGNHAKSYKKFITNTTHHIIESAHPSPLSAHKGFYGSKPFTKINKIIESINGHQEIIKWH
jgi:uracil-DNA glycosylase